MRLKTASLLVLIGTLLVTLLLLVDFVGDLLAFLRDLIPVARMVRSLFEAFAGVTVVVFLYVFYKAQPPS